MTRLLEQAVAKARSLPDDQQDAIGRLVLEKIDVQASPTSRAEPRIEMRGGMPVVVSPSGSRPITSDDVASAMEDE